MLLVSTKPNIYIYIMIKHGLYLSNLVCPMDFSCLNGGTCVYGRCSCTDGFAGTECEKSKTNNVQLIP